MAAMQILVSLMAAVVAYGAVLSPGLLTNKVEKVHQVGESVATKFGPIIGKGLGVVKEGAKEVKETALQAESEAEAELEKYLDAIVTRVRDQYTIDGKFTPVDPMKDIEATKKDLETVMTQLDFSSNSKSLMEKAVDFAHKFIMTILAEQRPKASVLKDMIAQFASEHRDDLKSTLLTSDLYKLRDLAVLHFGEEMEVLASTLDVDSN